MFLATQVRKLMKANHGWEEEVRLAGGLKEFCIRHKTRLFCSRNFVSLASSDGSRGGGGGGGGSRRKAAAAARTEQQQPKWS